MTDPSISLQSTVNIGLSAALTDYEKVYFQVGIALSLIIYQAVEWPANQNFETVHFRKKQLKIDPFQP